MLEICRGERRFGSLQIEQVCTTELKVGELFEVLVPESPGLRAGCSIRPPGNFSKLPNLVPSSHCRFGYGACCGVIVASSLAFKFNAQGNTRLAELFPSP